jgi:prophage regulatory protein
MTNTTDQQTQSFQVPPEHTLLSLAELYPITKMKRTSTYAAIKKDGFPEPIHLGQRLVAWRLSEVLAWVESRPRGTRPIARKGAQQ